ncbi:MAG: OmpL47-type beta-barrel domain-containing protein, partial [Clostridia bacterium]
PLMELPFVFRAREQGKGLTRYVGHFRDKYFVDPAEWATIPVEERVFFASPEEAESAGYSRDNAAPTTIVGFSQEPNDSGWWNQDVTVSLEASDDQSGIRSTEIQIDGGEWNTYDSPVVVTKEGDTIISYRSKDRVGNVEEAKSVTVKLDKTLPVWELTQSGEPVHTIQITDSITLDVKAEDTLSGIQSVTAEIDDQKVDLNKEYSARSLGLGSHTIQVTVVDQAGNVGQQSYTFTIETSLETIHSLVDGLLSSKDIKNKGIATSIKAKLDTIQRFYESGDDEQAKKHLTDLQERLHTYAESGSITDNADELLQSNLDYLVTMENWKL